MTVHQGQLARILKFPQGEADQSGVRRHEWGYESSAGTNRKSGTVPNLLSWL